jgi:peptidoglycan/xylan/chitin deacetylase (PgdA/CDA1 family)
MPELRPDRLFSVSVVQPALRMLRQCSSPRVPILMYHRLRRESEFSQAYFETTTAPEKFAAHMQFLRDSGYTTVRMDELFAHSDGGQGHQKRVAITFDDGNSDFYTEALPVLLRHGFTATVFVITGFTSGSSRTAAENYLTWSEIKEIHAQGIEIGSHTVSHPELWRLSHRELEYEIRNSKDTIEQQLGAKIGSFSHPFAFPEHDKAYTSTLCDLLEQHGYETAVSTIIGTAEAGQRKYTLPRLPVNSHDDLRLFQAKLDGAYDWVHVAQRVYKSWLKKGAGPKRKSAVNNGGN